MKKTLAFVLSFLLGFSSFVGLAAAERELAGVVKRPERDLPTGGYRTDALVPADDVKDIEPKRGISLFSDDEAEQVPFEEYLEEQLRNHTKHIEVYPEYMIYADYDAATNAVYVTEFQQILRKILFNNYDILVLDDVRGCGCGHYVGESTYFIWDFEPVYLELESDETEESVLEMMDDAIDGYVDAVEDIPTEDVVGKLLVIHDLFCANNDYAREEYDEEWETMYTDNPIVHNEARTAYYLFKYNRAVCQGNVIAIKAIFDRLNERLKEQLGTNEDIIVTSFCASNDLAHVWNVVKVNGHWYHFDETWDDSSNPGEALYDYFLRCDAEFIDSGDEYVSSHSIDGVTDWEFYTDEEVICDDDRYSHGYIFNKIYYGLITYSDGFYNIDAYGYRFRSGGIITTKILATDAEPYEMDGTTYNLVTLLTEGDPVTSRRITATYGSDETVMNGRRGVRLDNNVMIGATYSFTGFLFRDEMPMRVFFWAPDTYEPLCRAIDVPAIVVENEQ